MKKIEIKKYIEGGKTFFRILGGEVSIPYHPLRLQKTLCDRTPCPYGSETKEADEFAEAATAASDAATIRVKYYCDLKTVSRRKRKPHLIAYFVKIKAAYQRMRAEYDQRLQIIEEAQRKQKQIIERRRKHNAAHLVAKKRAARIEKEENKKALQKGEFWKLPEGMLKKMFAPFKQNYIADISAKWRAVLILEVKLQWDNYLEYKRLLPTHKACLAGIDDNGEEWQIMIERRDQGGWIDSRWDFSSTVEEAMELVWALPRHTMRRAVARQGEILILPAEPADEMKQEEAWQIAVSHTAVSPGLRHNGSVFASDAPIRIEHPTHKPIILPPGCYKALVHHMGAD